MMSYVLRDAHNIWETGWLIAAHVMHESIHTPICDLKRVKPDLWHVWRETHIHVPRVHKTKSTAEDATRLPPLPPAGL